MSKKIITSKPLHDAISKKNEENKQKYLKQKTEYQNEVRNVIKMYLNNKGTLISNHIKIPLLQPYHISRKKWFDETLKEYDFIIIECVLADSCDDIIFRSTIQHAFDIIDY